MASSPQRHENIAVIGAGVIGLTTAVRLAEHGYRVRIFADRFSPETDSDAACAIFLPIFSYSGSGAEYLQKISEWARASWTRFIAMDFNACGLRETAAIELYADQKDVPPFAANLLANSRLSFRPELPIGYQWVLEFDTLIIEMPRYMRWLDAECERLKIVRKYLHFHTIEDIRSVEADIVVNCLGLGAREIFNDLSLRSVRGQIILHPPVHLDVALGGGIFCLYPRSDALVIGTLWLDGSDAQLPDKESYALLAETLEYWKENILPKLGISAKEIAMEKAFATTSGRRPVRPQVRLEKDPRGRFIHNYGHGGIGVTLSWGCANDVLKLVSSTD